MSELLIAIIMCLSFSFLYLLYEKQKEIKRINQTYHALKNENKILLQQLSVIREDKAYEGIHLREVQQAFEQLEDSMIKLRMVCKIKAHDIEKDKKLEKWQGAIPHDESVDLSAPSQIKISFNTTQGINETNISKTIGKGKS